MKLENPPPAAHLANFPAAAAAGEAAAVPIDAGTAAAAAAALADERAAPRVSTRQFLELFSAVMVPMFLAVADQTLLATATPRIAAELGGLRDTTWIALGYLMSVTISVPLYGRLGDRYGRRNILLMALAIFALGSAGCGFAPSLGGLIAARVVQGLGGGGLMVMAQALVGELVPGRERARFQGYFAINFTVASISGPLIGGVVVQHGDWRWLFLANLPLAAIAVWRVLRLPRGRIGSGAAVEDVPGVVLFALVAATLLVWVTFGGHRFAWESALSVALGAAALGGSVLLVLRERAQRTPFLPVELLRNRSIALLAGAITLFAACLFALVFYLPIYLQLGHGAKAATSGTLLLWLSLGMVFGATGSGRIIARTGRPTLLPAVGMALSAVGLLLVAVLPPAPWILGALCLAIGLGFGTVMPTGQVTIQSLAGQQHLGAAAALISLARAIGGVLGTALFGALAFGLMSLGAPVHGAGAGGGAVADLAALADGPQVVLAFRLMFGAVAATAALSALSCARIKTLQL